MELAETAFLRDPNGARNELHHIGVTGALRERVHRHRIGEGSEFCRKWGLTRLVYAEPHARMDEAIAREKALKRWKRAWKLNLIGRANPDWRDLWDDIHA